MRVITTEKAKFTRRPKQEMEDLIKKTRKENEVMVKGRFDFIDAQGGWLDFSIRLLPGDPILTIHISDGEICEIPMGVVKHLNGVTKKVRQSNLKLMENGQESPHTKMSRMRFTPIDYL